ncbi:F-box domain-containing protein [Artemisia annua]|uniref:F-box domain-containing protein n=1 Tax=Artemisia annua TaxID=35608 RepID=A0A2U1N6S6_ARTAN|nr:F-box domain-containing protein [Artemisia annua]
MWFVSYIALGLAVLKNVLTVLCNLTEKDTITTELPSNIILMEILPRLPTKLLGRRLISLPRCTTTSFDGLLCLAAMLPQELAFWNPLTGAFKKLSDNSCSPRFYKPSCTLRPLKFSPDNISSSSDVIGFYIDSSNDYKLLHMVSNGALGAYVYSLRTDSWRKIEYLIDNADCISNYHWSPATFWEHNLYFVVLDLAGDQRCIICFDVKSEKFRKIQFPTIHKYTSSGFQMADLLFLKRVELGPIRIGSDLSFALQPCFWSRFGYWIVYAHREILIVIITIVLRVWDLVGEFGYESVKRVNQPRGYLVRLSPGSLRKTPMRVFLVVLDGCIHLCVCYLLSERLSLLEGGTWRMDGKDGWLKVMDFSNVKDDSKVRRMVCMTRNENWLAIGDQENDSFEEIDFVDFATSYSCLYNEGWVSNLGQSSTIYHETLVSPNAPPNAPPNGSV